MDDDERLERLERALVDAQFQIGEFKVWRAQHETWAEWKEKAVEEARGEAREQRLALLRKVEGLESKLTKLWIGMCILIVLMNLASGEGLAALSKLILGH